MFRRYTIEDIACTAGVSRGTVSRVLNENPSVSDETRQRVLDVIEKLTYLPSFNARHMRTNSSNLVMLELITDEVITTPYAVDMISGAQEILWVQGKVMLVINAGYATEMTEASLERRVEGIIYAAMYHREVELPPKCREFRLCWQIVSMQIGYILIHSSDWERSLLKSALFPHN